MDDDGSAEDLVHGKAVGEKDGESSTVGAEEGLKVARVVGVGTVVGVIVHAHVGKGVAVAGTDAVSAVAVATVAALVNVESENRVFASRVRGGKSHDLSGDEGTVSGVVKADVAADLGISVTAADLRMCLRARAQKCGEVRECVAGSRIVVHDHTSYVVFYEYMTVRRKW